MAQRWLRGWSPNTGTSNNNTDTACYALLFYYFLRRILGYQFIEEVVSGGPTRTFENNHDATNTDGAFAGSTLTFTSASNPFAPTDVGKFLVLVDSTNDENCGIYPITLYNGTGSVDINFFSTAFPTAASGITWYMVDDGSVATTKLPFTNGDYAILRVNHASYPWEVKCTYHDANQAGNMACMTLEVATEANSWDTSPHAWKSSAPVLNKVIGCASKYHAGIHSRVYAYGRTEGDILVGFTDQVNNTTKACSYIAVIDPFETAPARTARERLVIGGFEPQVGQAGTDRGIESDRDWTPAQFWSEEMWFSHLSYWCGFALQNTSTDYFSLSLGVNARTGERDGFPIWLMADPATTEFLWAPLGQIDSSQLFLGTAIGIGNFTTFDSNQYMHLTDGVCVPWNGINQA